MTIYDQIGWVGDVISLIGSWQVAHRKRHGYIIFMISELFLVVPVLEAHVWNQVALGLAYLGINIVGYYKWGKL